LGIRDTESTELSWKCKTTLHMIKDKCNTTAMQETEPVTANSIQFYGIAHYMTQLLQVGQWADKW